MSKFGWAYVSSVSLSTGSVANGPTGSLQFHSGSQALSGSDKLLFDPDTNKLTLLGTLTGSSLVVSASVISASTYLGITGGGTPGGANQQIQFNSGSSFSGSSNLKFNYTTNELSLTGNLIVSGTLYANEYHTNIISSSIIYSSGSTKFGDDGSDTHQFTGSILAGEISGTTAQFTTITASNITIGTAEDGDYTDGLFTTFTSNTSIGTVVDKFNEVLKGLAPTQAPNLSNLERSATTPNGTTMKLSFGASSSTGSYSNVTASLSGLSNVDIGGSYTITNGAGGRPIRMGVFAALQDLTATLNNSTTANAGTFTNYPADSFNVSADGVGSYIIEMNDVVLTPTGSTTNTGSYTANNFSLSLANTASFISTGLGFDLFRHRTGTMTIPTASWRLGENYVKVTHVSSLGTHVTNYIDWVYDPQAAAGNSVYGFTTTSASFNITGEKALSGVKYYTACTYSFSSSIANYYKNVYSNASNGGITFGSLTTGLTAAAFGSTPAPSNSDVPLERSSTHTLANTRILSATLSSTMTVNNGLGKTGTSTLTTPTILFDAVNTANSNTLENFCLEDFRVSSASYDSQASLTSAGLFPSASSLNSSELAVYSGSLVYPTRIFNGGNVAGSGITYMISGQPNYSGVTEDRYYFRKFVNGGGSVATFNLVLTGSNINFVPYSSALTTNNVKIAIKVPGKTGWRDALTAASVGGGALDDNRGCLNGTAPANIGATAAGRNIGITLLTEGLVPSESYLVRILTSKDWNGTLTKLEIV
jgi:hypothetical protein